MSLHRREERCRRKFERRRKSIVEEVVKARGRLNLGAVWSTVGEVTGLVAVAVKSALTFLASRVSKSVVSRSALSSPFAAVVDIPVSVDACVLAVVLVELVS